MRQLSEIITTLGENDLNNYKSLEGRVFIEEHPTERMQLRKITISVANGESQMHNEFVCGVDVCEILGGKNIVVSTYGHKWASDIKGLICEVDEYEAEHFLGHHKRNFVCYYLMDDPIWSEELGESIPNESIRNDLEIFEGVELMRDDLCSLSKPLEDIIEKCNSNKK